MLESSLVLYMNKIVTADLGHFTTVEFDFLKIRDFVRKTECFMPQYLEFYHVHPSGFLRYSDKDVNCVEGFEKYFKMILSFSIITFDSPNINCLNHKQVTYKYHNGEMLLASRRRLSGKYLQLLKTLSYGDVLSCRE